MNSLTQQEMIEYQQYVINNQRNFIKEQKEMIQKNQLEIDNLKTAVGVSNSCNE